MKLRRIQYCTKPGYDGCVNTEGSEHADAGWLHWCPACNEAHMIAVEHANSNGAKWTFDGNMEAPTFAPSVLIKIGPFPTVPVGRPDAGMTKVCHYFIRQGNIEFCSDCTHELAGKTVPLPDYPADED